MKDHFWTTSQLTKITPISDPTSDAARLNGVAHAFKYGIKVSPEIGAWLIALARIGQYRRDHEAEESDKLMQQQMQFDSAVERAELYKRAMRKAAKLLGSAYRPDIALADALAVLNAALAPDATPRK